jgi:hypothetical protein
MSPLSPLPPLLTHIPARTSPFSKHVTSVDGSSLSRTVTPTDLAKKLKGLHTDHGIPAFKIKIAQRMGHNIDVYPNRSEEVGTSI